MATGKGHECSAFLPASSVALAHSGLSCCNTYSEQYVQAVAGSFCKVGQLNEESELNSMIGKKALTRCLPNWSPTGEKQPDSDLVMDALA